MTGACKPRRTYEENKSKKIRETHLHQRTEKSKKHQQTIASPKPVLRIHDIFCVDPIQIRLPMPLTNGSGSGSCYFRH
jgi:hypothetical protein